MLSQLERSIIQHWHERVAADLADHPLDTDDRYRALEEGDRAALVKSPVKAYGATFIAAVLTDSCFFVLKLGDGNACLLTRDLRAQLLNHLFPQLEDDELQFNLTTSLCNSFLGESGLSSVSNLCAFSTRSIFCIKTSIVHTVLRKPLLQEYDTMKQKCLLARAFLRSRQYRRSA